MGVSTLHRDRGVPPGDTALLIGSLRAPQGHWVWALARGRWSRGHGYLILRGGRGTRRGTAGPHRTAHSPEPATMRPHAGTIRSGYPRDPFPDRGPEPRTGEQVTTRASQTPRPETRGAGSREGSWRRTDRVAMEQGACRDCKGVMPRGGMAQATGLGTWPKGTAAGGLPGGPCRGLRGYARRPEGTSEGVGSSGYCRGLQAGWKGQGS